MAPDFEDRAVVKFLLYAFQPYEALLDFAGNIIPLDWPEWKVNIYIFAETIPLIVGGLLFVPVAVFRAGMYLRHSNLPHER